MFSSETKTYYCNAMLLALAKRKTNGWWLSKTMQEDL